MHTTGCVCEGIFRDSQLRGRRPSWVWAVPLCPYNGAWMDWKGEEKKPSFFSLLLKNIGDQVHCFTFSATIIYFTSVQRQWSWLTTAGNGWGHVFFYHCTCSIRFFSQWWELIAYSVPWVSINCKVKQWYQIKNKSSMIVTYFISKSTCKYTQNIFALL